MCIAEAAKLSDTKKIRQHLRSGGFSSHFQRTSGTKVFESRYECNFTSVRSEVSQEVSTLVREGHSVSKETPRPSLNVLVNVLSCLR